LLLAAADDAILLDDGRSIGYPAGKLQSSVTSPSRSQRHYVAVKQKFTQLN
jgi:hypothetical protein